jgi:hypothetical protein
MSSNPLYFEGALTSRCLQILLTINEGASFKN